jgi:ATP-binding cassette subfamily B protein
MMAFMQYATHVIMSFMFIAMMFIFIPRAAVSGARIAEVLTTENSIKDPIEPVTFSSEKKGLVEFKNVGFRYENADGYALKNLSFIAKPGEMTAIIGSTGSGKSTVANLLMRFYDVTDGQIVVEGADVREVTQHDLRQRIGYVPQKGVLLSGTIKSNLKYGDPDSSDELVEKSAEIAQAVEFINDKAEKYDDEITAGGTNVSGGQRQRLSIARALVKKPPIFIFDDSFSALDFKTDAALRRALKEYTGDSTVIVIAQRVGTIMNADNILVLDKGKLVGHGKHRELLRSCPEYYEIASSQLSGEELGE